MLSSDLLSLLNILPIKAHREHCHDHHNFHNLIDKTEMTTKQLLVLCYRFLEFPPDSTSFRSVLLKEKDPFAVKDLKNTHPLVELVSWCKAFIHQRFIHTQDFSDSPLVTFLTNVLMIYDLPCLFHITEMHKDTKNAEWRRVHIICCGTDGTSGKKLNLKSKNLDVSKNTKQLLHTKEVLMQSQAWNTKMQMQ